MTFADPSSPRSPTRTLAGWLAVVFAVAAVGWLVWRAQRDADRSESDTKRTAPATGDGAPADGTPSLPLPPQLHSSKSLVLDVGSSESEGAPPNASEGPDPIKVDPLLFSSKAGSPILPPTEAAPPNEPAENPARRGGGQ